MLQIFQFLFSFLSYKLWKDTHLAKNVIPLGGPSASLRWKFERVSTILFYFIFATAKILGLSSFKTKRQWQIEVFVHHFSFCNNSVKLDTAITWFSLLAFFIYVHDLSITITNTRKTKEITRISWAVPTLKCFVSPLTRAFLTVLQLPVSWHVYFTVAWSNSAKWNIQCLQRHWSDLNSVEVCIPVPCCVWGLLCASFDFLSP